MVRLSRRHVCPLLWLGAALLLASSLVPRQLAAQRPFRIYDPFYRSETARRSFFDGYALTAEISYRRPGALQQTSIPVEGEDYQGDYQPAGTADPIGLSFHLDYQLAKPLDLRAILDASSGPTGRRITLSWLALKYYRHLENADYALRFAVDPAPDGHAGFPQMDAAFIHTSALSPIVSSDFAIGMRRVRLGYQQLIMPESPGSFALPGTEEEIAPPPPESEEPLQATVYRRAIGLELHAMLNYSFHFDPARSNLFVALFGDLSSYDLIELRREYLPPEEQGDEALAARVAGTPQPVSPWSSEYRGGVIWLRTGLSFNRPSYRAVPFLAIPLRQWMPEEGRWHRAAAHVGLQFMLR